MTSFIEKLTLIRKLKRTVACFLKNKDRKAKIFIFPHDKVHL